MKMATSKKWIKAVLGLDKSSTVKSSEKDAHSSGGTDKIQHQRTRSEDIIQKIQLNSAVVSANDNAKNANFLSVKNFGETDSGSTDTIWHQREHYNEIESDIMENQLDTDVVSEIDSTNDANFLSVKDFGEFDSGALEYELDPNVITEFEGVNDASFLSARHSVEISSGIPENEVNFNATTEIEDAQGVDFQSILDPASLLSTSLAVSEIKDSKDASFQCVLDPPCSSSTLLQVQNAAPIQQSMSEELAAIRIQAAFRRFLARRALRSLRGMVRLHSLTGGHAVKKQVAITLHSMQDLVRVQARARTRQGRVALENQIACQQLQQHVEHEDCVTEFKGGWCGSVGSAEQVKAKTLKKKEAAARREKAMAYALARQWQAGSRQRVKPADRGQDKVYWSWKWLESWLASSQWEIQSSDTDVEDGAKPCANEPVGPLHRAATQVKSTGKKLTLDIGNRKLLRSSSYRSDTSNEGNASSPTVKETSTPPRTPSRSPRPVVAKDSVKESTSSLNVGQRSCSTPRERSPLADSNGKKRLSLPNSRPQNEVQPAKQLSRPAVKRTTSAPKLLMLKTKSNGTYLQSPK